MFEAPGSAEPRTVPTDQEMADAAAQPRAVPMVRIDRVDTQVQGEMMTVYGEVRNESPLKVSLDKIRVLAAVQELDSTLAANEERQYKLYEGPLLNDTAQHTAQLIYKDEKGDYFQADHYIEFHYHDDRKRYSIAEFKLVMPIRDI